MTGLSANCKVLTVKHLNKDLLSSGVVEVKLVLLSLLGEALALTGSCDSQYSAVVNSIYIHFIGHWEESRENQL